MVYNKSATESAQVTLIFNISINAITGGKAPVAEAVTFYPNPTTGMVHFSDVYSWEVRNITGNELARGRSVSVDLSAYPAGVYFIKVTSGKETVMEKIIKR